jgi:hypothetical protein
LACIAAASAVGNRSLVARRQISLTVPESLVSTRAKDR